MIEAAHRWYDPNRNFTRPDDLAALQQRFEKQFDPEEIVQAMVDLAEGKSNKYRTVLPKESEEFVRQRQEKPGASFRPLHRTHRPDRGWPRAYVLKLNAGLLCTSRRSLGAAGELLFFNHL